MAFELETLPGYIDHTLLEPNATEEDEEGDGRVTKGVRTVCLEAVEHGFRSVCIAPAWIRLASRLTRSSSTGVAAVIGFPHGNTLSSVKAYEAEAAIEAGADELDMVVNVGSLRSGDLALVTDDIAGVVASARKPSREILVKVILETGFLTDEQKEAGCRAAMDAGADMVKTSTGFGPGGATVEDVRLLRRVVGDRLGVKAAGGIRDLKTAIALIEAGATRLGCSSSIRLMDELRKIEAAS